jgi:hypothetical protein
MSWLGQCDAVFFDDEPAIGAGADLYGPHDQSFRPLCDRPCSYDRSRYPFCRVNRLKGNDRAYSCIVT